MNTALHPTDQLALAATEVDTRERDAASHARSRDPRPRPGRLLTRIAFTTAVVALTVGAASPAVAEVVTEFPDTYTGGDRIVHGLADGWFEPSPPSSQPHHPIGRVR